MNVVLNTLIPPERIDDEDLQRIDLACRNEVPWITPVLEELQAGRMAYTRGHEERDDEIEELESKVDTLRAMVNSEQGTDFDRPEERPRSALDTLNVIF